jgi:hypothetical protein
VGEPLGEPDGLELGDGPVLDDGLPLGLDEGLGDAFLVALAPGLVAPTAGAV